MTASMWKYSKHILLCVLILLIATDLFRLVKKHRTLSRADILFSERMLERKAAIQQLKQNIKSAFNAARPSLQEENPHFLTATHPDSFDLNYILYVTPENREYYEKQINKRVGALQISGPGAEIVRLYKTNEVLNYIASYMYAGLGCGFGLGQTIAVRSIRNRINVVTPNICGLRFIPESCVHINEVSVDKNQSRIVVEKDDTIHVNVEHFPYEWDKAPVSLSHKYVLHGNQWK